MFSKLGENPLKLWSLNKEEKILLSYLLSDFLPPVTQNLLKDKTSQIQIPIYVRIVNSYTAHLLKLDSEEFSKNQLNEKAGTGGSTNNYVVSMDKIGLIENIRSDKGNAVYKIKDPKIIFCQKHNLELKK